MTQSSDSAIQESDGQKQDCFVGRSGCVIPYRERVADALEHCGTPRT